jgi:DNA-binding NarL/FixJ family response regulator
MMRRLSKVRDKLNMIYLQSGKVEENNSILWILGEAENGEEALELLKISKTGFDVIVVDQTLSSNEGIYGHQVILILYKYIIVFHLIFDTQVVEKIRTDTSFGMSDCVVIGCTGNLNRNRQVLQPNISRAVAYCN